MQVPLQPVCAPHTAHFSVPYSTAIHCTSSIYFISPASTPNLVISTTGSKRGMERPIDHGEKRGTSEPIAEELFLPEHLKVYYSRFFPYELLYRWLVYGQGSPKPAGAASELSGVMIRDYFARREFNFTLEDDIFVRYLSFPDMAALRKSVISRQPYKIDVGAVFTLPPNQHDSVSKAAFRTVERELVFDIDLTDYDPIRTCCSGAGICTKCWKFMTAAITFLDETLREDFGFQHIVWVFSGRRGIHGWVCDDAARGLSNEARSAVVEYCAAIGGGNSQTTSKADTVQITTPLHPVHARAMRILEPLFVAGVLDDNGQGWLGDKYPERWGQILELVPDVEGLHDTLRKAWKRAGSAADRWKQLRGYVEGLKPDMQRNKDFRTLEALNRTVTSIVFYFMFPRLDENVSKHQNHLLKIPFCVHPKTGKVCVPLTAAKAASFNPLTVPKVNELPAQAARYDETHSATAAPEFEWEKTPLAPYYYDFLDFLKPMEAAATAVLRARAEGTCAAGLLLLARRSIARVFADVHARARCPLSISDSPYSLFQKLLL